MKQHSIQTPDKLGVLLPGLGAKATTLIADVKTIRYGLTQPIGPLTQIDNIQPGKRKAKSRPRIKDFVPLKNLSDLILCEWGLLFK